MLAVGAQRGCNVPGRVSCTSKSNPPPVAARQAEVARGYLKRAARIGELNGHPPGSDGPMATALKRYNGGRVLVFMVGAFAEMSEDVSRICDTTAHDLARTELELELILSQMTHVSYYSDLLSYCLSSPVQQR